MSPHSSPDRYAFILGSSSGSGAAIARAVARDPGLHLFGVHRGNHRDSARAVAEAVQAAGRGAHECIDDAGRLDRIEPIADVLAATVPPGSVKLFVHSIANASVGYLAEVPPARPGEAPKLLHHKQIDKTFQSMAHSFVYWVRELHTRRLLAPGARLLALTNAINDSTLGNLSVIAAAKAALETYVRHLAWELGPLGHRVNALKYGTVETAALKWIFPEALWEQVREIHHAMHPAGRMITTDEVGAFVSVLAGDAGEWFNGAVIDMTGAQMTGVYDVLMREVMSRAAGGRAAARAPGVETARERGDGDEGRVNATEPLPGAARESPGSSRSG